MGLTEQIDLFFSGQPFAVIGASTDRNKYGNKVLRNYLQRSMRVFAINPKVDVVEGLQAYPTLKALPEKVHGVSIITPPSITERVVEEALALGVKNFWLQPGAESPKAIQIITKEETNAIYGGPCLLVVLGFREGG